VVCCQYGCVPRTIALNLYQLTYSTGTGAVSVLFQSFPYGSRPILQALGAMFLILNIILFVIFLIFAVFRYVKHPEVSATNVILAFTDFLLAVSNDVQTSRAKFVRG
jgi:tellurite resistance protein TehA-like permease